MTHTDTEKPVRYVPAAVYVAQHRSRRTLVAIVHGWLLAGDWRLLVGAVVSLVAAIVLAVMTG